MLNSICNKAIVTTEHSADQYWLSYHLNENSHKFKPMIFNVIMDNFTKCGVMEFRKKMENSIKKLTEINKMKEIFVYEMNVYKNLHLGGQALGQFGVLFFMFSYEDQLLNIKLKNKTILKLKLNDQYNIILKSNTNYKNGYLENTNNKNRYDARILFRKPYKVDYGCYEIVEKSQTERGFLYFETEKKKKILLMDKKKRCNF